MKKLSLLAAALLFAAPVFAHDHDDGDRDDDDYQRYDYDDDAPPPPRGPSFDDFRNDGELSWNGEWIDTPEYGTVWRPTRVDDGWQPYLYGRWAWTTAGWAWVSDEPFGWAVYHYGRWAWSDAGWLWIPGRVWAPAWVEWRWGDGYAGWCPLSPQRAVYPQQWVYVGARHFLEPVRRNVIPEPQRQALPPPFRSGAGPHAGPSLPVVERATGRTIRPLSVADASGPHAAAVGAGSVGFYRPRSEPVAASPHGPRAGGAVAHAVDPRQPQQDARAGSPRPFYFDRAPAPRQGGQTGQPARRAKEPGAAENRPHAKER